MYRFSGECSYKLSETCGRISGLPTFRIVGKNEVTLDGSSSLKSIRLAIDGRGYLLDNTGRAFVRGSYVESYPYIEDDGSVVITYSYPSLVSGNLIM